jgi:hypothetical protein
MSRPKKVFAPGWLHTTKCKFLVYAYKQNSEAFRQLAVDVKNGGLLPGDWARTYDVGGTWIEEWARTMPAEMNEQEVWFNLPAGPDPFVFVPASDTQRVWYSRRSPGDAGTEIDLLLADGSKIKVRDLAEHHGFDYLIEGRRHFDAAVRQYIRENEIVIPGDLDLKLQTAAAYFFGRLAPTNIRLRSKATHEAYTKLRWVQEAAKVLKLRLRPVGRAKNSTR